jgi:hypothetical protein
MSLSRTNEPVQVGQAEALDVGEPAQDGQTVGQALEGQGKGQEGQTMNDDAVAAAGDHTLKALVNEAQVRGLIDPTEQITAWAAVLVVGNGARRIVLPTEQITAWAAVLVVGNGDRRIVLNSDDDAA